MKRWHSLLAVAIVATAIRVWYLFAYIGLQGGGISDDDSYHTFALNILQYGVYGHGTQPTAFVPPGMAIALAAVYRVFGPSFATWASFNILLNVLLCCVIGATARRVFGAAAGLTAGLTAAVYPQFLFRTIHTDAKTLMILGLCAGAWCLVREWESGKPRWIALAGVCFGIAYLARTQLVLLPVFFPAWAYLRYRPDIRRARWAAIVVLLGMLPAMMLWTARNYVQFGAVVPGMSGEGLALASINNEANFERGRSRGQVMVDTVSSLFTPESGYVDRAGHFTPRFLALPELEQDAILKRASLDWMRANPGKMAIMMLFKLKAVWLSPQNYSWPMWSRILNIPLYLGFVLPFGAAGLYYVLRVDPRAVQPMLIWLIIAAYTTLLQVVFEGEIRHRMAFEPGLIILASGGLAFTAEKLRRRQPASTGPLQSVGVRP